jgi:uncharacterized membrane protein YjjB (DUF3815 family)
MKTALLIIGLLFLAVATIAFLVAVGAPIKKLPWHK